MRFFYKISFLILIFSSYCSATHLAGGEIRASHISGQTYKISAILYLDINNGPGAVEAQSSVMACMGDGSTITLPRISLTSLTGSGGISVGLYEANYTYPSSGTFQISVSENNRSNTLNFPNGNQSVFFIWTVINTQLSNSTPVMPYLNFDAGVRQVFSVDLKPTVADADSISIRLQKLSKPSPGTCGVRSIDQSYIFPNEVSKTGTFKIDQTQKKLLWTAPEQVGSYTYGMVVAEWRDGIKISDTYREGRVNVIDKPGATVEIPPYAVVVLTDDKDPEIITSTPTLDSPEMSIAVEAYPVPTENFITVKAYSKKRSLMTLQVVDLQGRILQEIKSKVPELVIQEQFDLRNYSKGIYLIRAKNDKESVTQKILR